MAEVQIKFKIMEQIKPVMDALVVREIKKVK